MSKMLKKSATVKKGSGSADRADASEHKEADVMIDRFLEYKSITKGYIAYYQGLAALETNNSTEITKLAAHIPAIHDSSLFLPHGGGGGVQDILQDTRDQTREVAEKHSNLAHAITEGPVHALERTKTEIKNFIAELESEPSRVAKSVGEHRAESTRLISALNQGIATATSNALELAAKDDPVLLHRQVEGQLKKQINEENTLTRTLITYQKRSAELEAKVIKDIQAATAAFAGVHSNARTGITSSWESIHARIAALNPSREHDEYAKRSGHLIDEKVAMRDPSQISFPGQEDTYTKPVRSGLLERKQKLTHKYKESFYVLTPAGYLHEHKSAEPSEPELSIFLPECVLGPPALEGSKSHKWHCESSKKQSGFNKFKKTLRVGGRDKDYTFKARSFADMMEWHKAMEGPAKASLAAATVTSNRKDGSAVAAVKGVGLSPTSPTSPHRAGDSAEENTEGSSDEEEAVDAPSSPAAVDATTDAEKGELKASEILPEYQNGGHQAVAGDVKEKPTIGNDVPQASTSA